MARVHNNMVQTMCTALKQVKSSLSKTFQQTFSPLWRHFKLQLKHKTLSELHREQVSRTFAQFSGR